MIDLVLMIVRFSHRSSTLDVKPTEFWVCWFWCFIFQSTVIPSTHAQQCFQSIKNKSWKSWVLNPSAFGFFCICWWCVLDWKRENVNANSSFAHVRSYSGLRNYETCKGKYTWKYFEIYVDSVTKQRLIVQTYLSLWRVLFCELVSIGCWKMLGWHIIDYYSAFLISMTYFITFCFRFNPDHCLQFAIHLPGDHADFPCHRSFQPSKTNRGERSQVRPIDGVAGSATAPRD